MEDGKWIGSCIVLFYSTLALKHVSLTQSYKHFFLHASTFFIQPARDQTNNLSVPDDTLDLLNHSHPWQTNAWPTPIICATPQSLDHFLIIHLISLGNIRPNHEVHFLFYADESHLHISRNLNSSLCLFVFTNISCQYLDVIQNSWFKDYTMQWHEFKNPKCMGTVAANIQQQY